MHSPLASPNRFAWERAALHDFEPNRIRLHLGRRDWTTCARGQKPNPGTAFTLGCRLRLLSLTAGVVCSLGPRGPLRAAQLPKLLIHFPLARRTTPTTSTPPLPTTPPPLPAKRSPSPRAGPSPAIRRTAADKRFPKGRSKDVVRLHGGRRRLPHVILQEPVGHLVVLLVSCGPASLDSRPFAG